MIKPGLYGIRAAIKAGLPNTAAKLTRLWVRSNINPPKPTTEVLRQYAAHEISRGKAIEYLTGHAYGFTRAQADWLLQREPVGVFIPGTSGEIASQIRGGARKTRRD